MAEHRSTNKSLIEEISSEVTPATSPLLDILVANARRIAVLAIVCILAGAGFGVFNWQSKKKIVAAQENLGRILTVQNPADRLPELKALLGDAPAAVTDSVTLALAATAIESKDYVTAENAWGTLAKDIKNPLYVTAMVGKAEALNMQGKTSEALAVAESIQLTADSESAYLVNSLIADLAEASEDFAKAIAACEKIIVTVASKNAEEADYWRQKAASLRSRESAAKS